MKRKSSRLVAIDSPFPDANVKLRLLEPRDSCHETLRERVYSGTYDRPFVVDAPDELRAEVGRLAGRLAAVAEVGASQVGASG